MNSVIEGLGFWVEDESQLPGQVLKRSYRYWAERCDNGNLPGRQDLDPVDIPELLPNIMLVDVLRREGRFRFRFRLMGEQQVYVAGRNMAGEFVEDGLERGASDVIKRFRRIVRRRRPHFWRHNFLTEEKKHCVYESVALPLASDGAVVDMIAAVAVPVFAPADLPTGDAFLSRLATQPLYNGSGF